VAAVRDGRLMRQAQIEALLGQVDRLHRPPGRR
jgi:hypothetical protein